MLTGERIQLRALEPDDAALLYRWENNPEHWRFSNTLAPFSQHTLERYIQSVEDIYAEKQLRLMICLKDGGAAVGCIDLFEFDPHHRRAGVGLLIGEAQHQRQGFASEALQRIIQYAFQTLYLHQLYANVAVDNPKSIGLFEKHGFQVTSTKKAWLRDGQQWRDEHLLQLINSEA